MSELVGPALVGPGLAVCYLDLCKHPTEPLVRQTGERQDPCVDHLQFWEKWWLMGWFGLGDETLTLSLDCLFWQLSARSRAKPQI